MTEQEKQFIQAFFTGMQLDGLPINEVSVTTLTGGGFWLTLGTGAYYTAMGIPGDWCVPGMPTSETPRTTAACSTCGKYLDTIALESGHLYKLKRGGWICDRCQKARKP